MELNVNVKITLEETPALINTLSASRQRFKNCIRI